MIDAFINYLTFVKRYSEHTLLNYRKDLDQFTSFNGEVEWQKVDQRDIRDFVMYLSKEQYAPRSIKRKLSALSRFFKYLQKENILENNPCKGVNTPKLNAQLPHFYKMKDLDPLLDQDVKNMGFEALRDYLVFKMLFFCGLRRAEIIALKLESVDLKQLTLKVLGKGNKERLIPLLPEIQSDLQVYIQLRKAYLSEDTALKYLFLTNSKKVMYPKFVYNIVNNYLKKADVAGKKSPHGLRHSFATHLLARGADIESVKELLGHNSLAATQVYLHHSIASLKEVYKKAHPKGE